MPPSELLAAIDIGSNTVRMLVARRDGHGNSPLFRDRSITGMGRHLRTTGELGSPEIDASVDTLRRFVREMRRLGVSRFRAVGTAALRDASNAGVFMAKAADVGIPVEVISPDDEAKAAWAGLRRSVTGRSTFVAMDIGGGSTEFMTGPSDAVSLPIGTAAISGLLPLSDPPEPWQVENLKAFFHCRIADGTARFGRRRFARLVGTAGTFTTIAALDLRMTEYRPEAIDGHTMTLTRLKHVSDLIVRSTDAERLAMPGMEKGRERYIVAGVIQAVAAMERFGAKTLVVSDAGLLEGIIETITNAKGTPA